MLIKIVHACVRTGGGGTCMHVRKGLVLRVRGLQFSCGAPPRPPALDPHLLGHTHINDITGPAAGLISYVSSQ